MLINGSKNLHHRFPLINTHYCSIGKLYLFSKNLIAIYTGYGKVLIDDLCIAVLCKPFNKDYILSWNIYIGYKIQFCFFKNLNKLNKFISMWHSWHKLLGD